jgi:hypothetical protein
MINSFLLIIRITNMLLSDDSSSVSYLNLRDSVQYSFINYCYILEAIDF